MERVRNLTPHDVVVLAETGAVIFVAEAAPARISTTTRTLGTLTTTEGSVPLVEIGSGEPVGLPEPQPGTWFIVSSQVASRLPHRDDLLVPTGLVRDADGAVSACRSLGRYRRSNGEQHE